METTPFSNPANDLALREYGASAEDAIFAAKLDINGFASSFSHCEQFADYVAQFVTSNRHESDRMNSMLAMCLNETLEMAYRYHGGAGALWIEARQIPAERNPEGGLALLTSIPVDPATMPAYEWCRGLLTRPDALESYRELARHGFEDAEHKTGLIELVLVHGVALSIHAEASSDQVTIVIIMPDDKQ